MKKLSLAGIASLTIASLGLAGCQSLVDSVVATTSKQFDYSAVKAKDGRYRVVPRNEDRFKDIQDETFHALKYINEKRIDKKYKPLKYDPHLAAYAFVRAKELSEKYSENHERPDGTNSEEVFVGGGYVKELILRNRGTPPGSEWRRDKTEKQYIYNKAFTRAGIGLYRGTYKQAFEINTHWWVMIMADDLYKFKKGSDYYFEDLYAGYKPKFYKKYEKKAGIPANEGGKGEVAKLYEKPFPETELKDLGDTRFDIAKDDMNPGKFKVIIPNDEINAMGNTIYDLIHETNKMRTEVGLESLEPKDTLSAYALVRSREMSRGHIESRPDGSNPVSGVRNSTNKFENAVVTDSPKAMDTIVAWLKDPRQSDAFLSKDFQSMGAGVTKKDGKYYWSGIFGEKNATTDYDF